MKKSSKIILCFTLLSVLICTTVFSVSASYVASESPRETILQSVVESNYFDDTDMIYYDYGVMNFEDNIFSGSPVHLVQYDETYNSVSDYYSVIRATEYLLEYYNDWLYYDLDSYLTGEDADAVRTLEYFTTAVEFNLNDFAIGPNSIAMDNFSSYVYPGEDNVDACYFTGRLRFPYGEIYEEYTPDGDFYVGSSGLQYVEFEFFPYHVNETVQPFVEVGKTVFVDFATGGYYEYESVSFQSACQLYFRDAMGMSVSEYTYFSDFLDLVDGCYRLEFVGEVPRSSTSMGLTVPYINTVSYNYVGDSFRVPMFPQEVEVEPFEWLLQSGQAALEFELLPNLTVGHILLILLAIPILIAALRLLAGG